MPFFITLVITAVFCLCIIRIALRSQPVTSRDNKLFFLIRKSKKMSYYLISDKKKFVYSMEKNLRKMRGEPMSMIFNNSHILEKPGIDPHICLLLLISFLKFQ